MCPQPPQPSLYSRRAASFQGPPSVCQRAASVCQRAASGRTRLAWLPYQQCLSTRSSAYAIKGTTMLPCKQYTRFKSQLRSLKINGWPLRHRLVFLSYCPAEHCLSCLLSNRVRCPWSRSLSFFTINAAGKRKQILVHRPMIQPKTNSNLLDQSMH